MGKFFWISEEDLIGFDSDAEHGHGIDSGSVDEDCTLEVRGYEGNKLVVSLRRPVVPYGAPAAIGTVFMINEETVLSWPSAIAARSEKEKERKRLAGKFCT